MTIELLNPDDTGEIPRPVGETRTRIDMDQEATQRINPRLVSAPSFDAIPRKVYDLDDTVVYLPQTIGCVDLEGPQKPPPPLPKPKYDFADAQPVAPWERVSETLRLSLHGALTADLGGNLRPAVPPKPAPPKPKPKYVGRHRRTVRSRLASAFARLWGAL